MNNDQINDINQLTGTLNKRSPQEQGTLLTEEELKGIVNNDKSLEGQILNNTNNLQGDLNNNNNIFSDSLQEKGKLELNLKNTKESLHGDISVNSSVNWEVDPTVPKHVKNITTNDIENWNNKQDHLIAGDNINISNANVISATIPEVGTIDYTELINKPKINNVELNGNKSLNDLGIKQDYTASDITFEDGDTFQSKYDNGDLKGPTGETGATGADGANGATFIPSVNNSGDISWTNDKGLNNPTTVNIKGPQGENSVYVGTEDPHNLPVLVWINPDGATDKDYVTRSEVQEMIEEAINGNTNN